MNLRQTVVILKEKIVQRDEIRLNLEDPVVKHLDGLLHKLLTQGKKIMATNDELLADVKSVQTQVGKIGTETTASLAKIAELEAAVAALPGGTSAEVDAAIAELKASVQAVDDMVADATQE